MAAEGAGPSLSDVYRKFGEASEVAQLLGTELGNLLFLRGEIAAGPAADLTKFVDNQKLGQLLKSLSADELVRLEEVLTRGLQHRNRLAHSFYREHAFRRHSEEGCSAMMSDLVQIHDAILDAYQAILHLSWSRLRNGHACVLSDLA